MRRRGINIDHLLGICGRCRDSVQKVHYIGVIGTFGGFESRRKAPARGRGFHSQWQSKRKPRLRGFHFRYCPEPPPPEPPEPPDPPEPEPPAPAPPAPAPPDDPPPEPPPEPPEPLPDELPASSCSLLISLFLPRSNRGPGMVHTSWASSLSELDASSVRSLARIGERRR